MIEEEEADAQGWARLVVTDDREDDAIQVYVDKSGTSRIHISGNHAYDADEMAALGRTFTRLSEQMRAKGVDWL